MSSYSESLSLNVLDTETYKEKSSTKVNLTFTHCDFLEIRKREVTSRGVAPLLYNFGLTISGTMTPTSQTRHNHSISLFLGTLTKRNANSPLLPNKWQKINTQIKRSRYYHTRENSFDQKNEKKNHQRIYCA